MFKNFNRCDIYILLLVLYQLQGTLYQDGIVNKIFMFLMIFISIIESVNTLRGHIPSILKVTLLLLLMYCIYGSYSYISGSTILYTDGRIKISYVYLITSLNSILPIFMFYYYTKKGLLDEKRIKIYTLIFLILSVKSFYRTKYLLSILLDREEFTNNAAYGFLNLIPTVFFFRKNPIIQYVLLSIIGVFIFLCVKRGAMFIGGFSILIFLYVNLKSVSRKAKIIVYVFTVIFIIGSIYIVKDMWQNSEYFVQRIEQTKDGNSSGRDMIFISLWDKFVNETNPLYILFGHGADSTIKLIGIEAHNDWLEILTNNGILGVIILLIFFINLTKTAFKQRSRFPKYMYYSFLLLIFITFCKTLFSMSIQEIAKVQSMLFGYFIYWSTRPKEELKKLQ
ncbi:MAG: O-antigen ligase family protein [Lentimicrobiaceae bacterium]|nr:O-antigen ligase family protein [Lentimicrobiaceae bacterium]